MRSIKAIVKTPSEALEAMVAGLLKQSQRSDFRVDMCTFGESDNTRSRKEPMCFGCAATCTIQQIAGIDLDADHIDTVDDRAEYLQLDYNEVDIFESAINYARCGDISELLNFYGFLDMWINADFKQVWDFVLENKNWEKDLDKVKEVILYLKERGA